MSTTTEFNKLRADLFGIMRGAIVHATATTLATSPTPFSVEAGITLANELRSRLLDHAASEIDPDTGEGAHGAATVPSLPAAASDAWSLRELVHGLAGAHNAHTDDTASHFRRDGANRCTYQTRDGGDAELLVMLLALKTAFNGHVGAAMASGPATA